MHQAPRKIKMGRSRLPVGQEMGAKMVNSVVGGKKAGNFGWGDGDSFME